MEDDDLCSIYVRVFLSLSDSLYAPPYLMQGTFPLRNSLAPAHSMPSRAMHTTFVWFTSF